MLCVYYSRVKGQLLLTPYKHTIVPPPMAAVTLKLEASVLQVAFGPKECPDDFIVYQSNGNVLLYSYKKGSLAEGNEKDTQGFRRIVQDPVLSATGRLVIRDFVIDSSQHDASDFFLYSILSVVEIEGSSPLILYPWLLRHLTWWKETMLLAVIWDPTTQSDYLIAVELTVNEKELIFTTK